jgi:hypothetical protein
MSPNHVRGGVKADRNSRENGARLPCREHLVLCLSLFAFMFVPAVAGEVGPGAMADSVHAASWTDCHAVSRTSDGHPLHYWNASWSYHLAFADEALCAPEHIGHIFSRRSTRPGIL